MKKQFLHRTSFIEKVLAAGVIPLLISIGVSTATYEPVKLGYSNIQEEPENRTIISSQGFLVNGESNPKKPGRVVEITPEGTISDKYEQKQKKQWFYDVQVLEDGKTHVTTRINDTSYSVTLNEEFEKQNNISFSAADTHDIEVDGNSTLLVAPMQKDYYENGQKTFDDRIFAYNTSSEEEIWEWKFNSEYKPPENYPRTGWTHLNDIERVNQTVVMASPRNFDKVIFLNESSKQVIENLSLGQTGNHSIINRQHNPDVVEWSEDRKALLIADSENNRVVEYSRIKGEWRRTWTAKTGLNWPRDADRLPNGNTLITDTLNHRVIEITPKGQVVWEVYVPWATYDSERVGTDEESDGPTARQMNTTGTYNIRGGTITAGGDVGKSNVCGNAKSVSGGTQRNLEIERLLAGTPLSTVGEKASDAYSRLIPWIKPSWMPEESLLGTPLAVIIISFVTFKTWLRERENQLF